MKVDPRVVTRVFEKMSEGTDAEGRRDGAGRKCRIEMGSAKADRLVGGLRAGFGSRHTARFINELGVSPGKKPIHKATVARAAKHQFRMVCSKRQTTKTGNRNKESAWAISRHAICSQFREDIATKKVFIDGTLFVDEHSEFCVLGKGGHHGQSSKWEWRAHMKDGTFCLPDEGGALEAPVLQQKPKNPSRADGIFGVCAPTPLGGRRREGRRMNPFRYKGKVVGVKTYEAALATEIERVRKLGQISRDRVANGETNRHGLWHDHCDPGVNPYKSKHGE